MSDRTDDRLAEWNNWRCSMPAGDAQSLVSVSHLPQALALGDALAAELAECREAQESARREVQTLHGVIEHVNMAFEKERHIDLIRLQARSWEAKLAATERARKAERVGRKKAEADLAAALAREQQSAGRG